MISYTQGNLLDSDAQALVNTVNTVGVMGKGIALMFKERFKENYELYRDACKANEVSIGELFVTQPNSLIGPKWIINFPTKEHWRNDSKIEWVRSGLDELRNFIVDNKIISIALPPLGSGNGGLYWPEVRLEIERALGDLSGVEIIVYEPTNEYQNVQKRMGTKKLTPARAIVAELVRRYWIQGLDCSLLEIQKMAWFAERVIETSNTTNVLDLQFRADRFGPYARRLNHLLNALDGSYLHCEKRIADAGPLDTIWFDESRRDYLKTYIAGKEFRPYLSALERTYEIIDGFESPFGLELLATIDWLLCRKHLEPEIDSIQSGLSKWPKGGDRKLRLFDERAIGIALGRLRESALQYRWSA